ncbi:hypothetical protein [Methanosphaerula palustris]|uniref:Uncharacterized protein n=1 Tax=Methanosphaerula palustris (strain ATCC BAA-1556 / DSM 19958 / E1-9c) TaxID=521011 RepID=B8GG62_METPE|nr:hypothetical protein [Methanosphaerula palustris]ACL16136.1 hypothetical protein Mpal_0774 [Methanosphaerula palustris E1-9c]
MDTHFVEEYALIGGEQAAPDPLRVRGAELRKTHEFDPDDAAVLDSCEREAAIYPKYKW